MRWKGACSLPARPSSGYGMDWGSSKRQPKWKIWPGRSQTVAECIWCPPLPDLARRTGTLTRGRILGITRGTTRAHLARAALEGIAFQVADVLDAMKEDSSLSLTELRVDGGASANDLLMQFQADISQVPVVRPQVIETTALGAAYLAGLAVGFWNSTNEIAQIWQADRVFEPAMTSDQVHHRRQRWREALRRAGHWEPRS